MGIPLASALSHGDQTHGDSRRQDWAETLGSMCHGPGDPELSVPHLPLVTWDMSQIPWVSILVSTEHLQHMCLVLGRGCISE